MNSTELRALLESHGIRPLKSRSQHFLTDARVPGEMAEAAAIKEGTRVLEIGPGPGILTEELLDRGAEVLAVELDARFGMLLRKRFAAQEKRFTLVETDVLALSSLEMVEKFPSGPGPYAIVANLPYAITSAIFQKFLFEQPRPTSITVMVQKEVADRILAKPGEMSSLAVMVQTLCRVSRVRDVPRGAFLPPPKVDSAVIHMELRSQQELDGFFKKTPSERYFSLVRKAFSERRKQIKNTLRSLVSDQKKLENALIAAKISPQARPEELSPEEWISLCDNLAF